MAPHGRLRRTIAAHPVLAAEAALLGVVVAGTAAFVALLLTSAPVAHLHAAVVALLAGVTLLTVVLVAHGVRDVGRAVVGDGWPSAGSAAWGLWRTAEVALAVLFLLWATGAVLLGADVGGPEPANPDARATLGVWILFSVALAALFEVALVAAVSVRLVLSAVGPRAEAGSS